MDLAIYYRDLGLSLTYANQIEEAKSLLVSAQENKVESVPLLQVSLAIAVSENREADCLNVANQILEKSQDTKVLLQTCFMVSDYFKGTGRLDQALEWLEKTERLELNREVLARRGEIYLTKLNTEGEGYREKNEAKALSIYRQLCQRSDALEIDHINYAIVLRMQENYNLSCKELENVFGKNPKNCLAAMYLAVISQEKGSITKAREYASLAISLYNELPREQQKDISEKLLEDVRKISP